MRKLNEKIVSIGHVGCQFLVATGKSALLLWRSLIGLNYYGNIFRLTIQQIYYIGVLSIIIICVSGLFIGMVLGLQGYTILSRYASTQAVGQLVALSLLRELGPVVTSLLFAGRAGSAVTSEIGLMKTTEQLSSLEMMGVDPLKRVIAPRFWAGIISLPILNCVFIMVGIFGCTLVTVNWLSVDSGSFWTSMQSSVDFKSDVMGGVIKSYVFAVIVTWTAVFQGYNSVPTSQGISLATTRTVVYSSLLVLGMDFILTAVMFRGA